MAAFVCAHDIGARRVNQNENRSRALCNARVAGTAARNARQRLIERIIDTECLPRSVALICRRIAERRLAYHFNGKILRPQLFRAFALFALTLTLSPRLAIGRSMRKQIRFSHLSGGRRAVFPAKLFIRVTVICSALLPPGRRIN